MGASTCGAKPLFTNVENQRKRDPTFVDAVGGEKFNCEALDYFPLTTNHCAAISYRS